MVSDTRNDDRKWITHGYFRTYEIAARVDDIARNPFAYIRELEGLTVDGGINSFITNWQTDTLAHKFARWVAHDMFVDDTSGPYVVTHERTEDGPVEVIRHMPVDLALRAYGISHDAFEVPPPDGEFVEIEPKVNVWRESVVVANACYNYFINGLQLSQEYDTLLNRISDEVFHIVFLNRAAMAGLNSYIAMFVRDLDADSFYDEPELAKFLRKNGGGVKRSSIPKWARRAVFFREHGRCATCGTDLSGLIDSMPTEQFDHMVPLAHGGLNDVTNLQLLCQKCNVRKSDVPQTPSARYRRWFETPRTMTLDRLQTLNAVLGESDARVVRRVRRPEGPLKRLARQGHPAW